MTLNNPDADFEVDAEAMSFIVETGCARAVVEDEDIDEMHVSNYGYGANVKLMIEATGDAVMKSRREMSDVGGNCYIWLSRTDA